MQIRQPSLTKTYLHPQVVELTDRQFVERCYSALLRRQPEFDDAEPLATVASRVALVVRLACSDEVRLTEGLQYEVLLQGFAEALGQGGSAEVVARQIRERLPSLEDFWSALPDMVAEIADRSLAMMVGSNPDPEVRMSYVYALIESQTDQGHGRDQKIAALEETVARLSARLTMLERKVF